MNPSIRQLEAFVTIAKLTSFTKAARQLHLSQSALTVQVRQLEETFGVQLFDRNTRSVNLTRVGADLFPAVEHLLHEFDSLVFDAREMSARNRGTVTVAGLPSVCFGLVPRVVAQFRQAYPGISVVIRDGLAQKVVSLVKTREADFGICSFDEEDRELRVTHLFSDRMSVLLPPDYSAKSRGEMKLEEISQLPLVFMNRGSGLRRLADKALTTKFKITPAYEVTYMTTAIGLVQAGLGAAILPSSAVESGQVGQCKVRPTALRRDIEIVRLAGRSLSPAALTFLKILTSVCREIYPRGD